MTPVRYGIIGIGRIARKGHIPELQRIPEAEIAAIATRNPETRRELKETLAGIEAYEDYRDLLADERVEAVVIATPNWLHKEQAIAAFEAGKHVLCEKPLGIDLEECDAVLAAHKRSGEVLQVGHELRYANLISTMHGKVAEGAIGQVQMMVIQEFRFPLLPGWRQTGKTGGVMLEKNSHFFDLFNWFADAEPVKVLGAGGNNVNKDSPLIDHCVITVEYRNRACATLVMCLFAEHGSQLTFDVVGDKGRLIAYAEDQRLLLYSRENDEPQEWRFEKGCDGEFHLGMRSQHEAFIRCIRQGEPVLSSGDAARRTLRVALAAERVAGGESVVALG